MEKKKTVEVQGRGVCDRKNSEAGSSMCGREKSEKKRQTKNVQLEFVTFSLKQRKVEKIKGERPMRDAGEGGSGLLDSGEEVNEGAMPQSKATSAPQHHNNDLSIKRHLSLSPSFDSRERGCQRQP